MRERLWSSATTYVKAHTTPAQSILDIKEKTSKPSLSSIGNGSFFPKYNIPFCMIYDYKCDYAFGDHFVYLLQTAGSSH